ncbi:MAG: prolyl oligopeptidase family serine peptidase [Planctomycetes bacterium]|nr:prolyl oligopeptidase family serine peptidase [Planctomycetota bacterium]
MSASTMTKSFVRAWLALLPFALCTTPQLLAQQQRALTHDDYDGWKSVRGQAYSDDGAWVAYQIEPQWGDGELIVRQSDGDTMHRFPLASGAKFSPNGRYVAFSVGKSKVEERDKKIAELRKKGERIKNGGAEEPEKEKKEEGKQAGGEPEAAAAPGRGGRRRGGPGGPGGAAAGGGADDEKNMSELWLLELATGEVEKLGKVRRWSMAEEWDLLLYQKAPKKSAEAKKDGDKASEKPAESKSAEANPEPAHGEAAKAEEKPAEKPEKKEKTEAEKKAEARAAKLEKARPEGHELTIRNLAKGDERTVADVVAHGFSRTERWLWYQTSAKKPVEGTAYGLFVEGLLDRRLDDPVMIFEGACNIADVSIDHDETAIAFLADLEQLGEDKPAKDVYVWPGGSTKTSRVAFVGQRGMPPQQRVAGSLTWSRDGKVLSFAVEDAPEPDPLPILDDDKVVLDLWNWRDGLLQTMQQKRGGGDRDDRRTAVWDRASDRVTVLGDDRTPTLRFVGNDGRYLLASDSRPYEQEVSWDGRYADAWLVDRKSGARLKVLEHHRGSVSSSPDGRYLLWFGDDYHWYTYEVETGVRRDLTGQLTVPFHHYDDDHPEPDGAFGVAGWTDGDGAVLLYDEFDLWSIDPQSGRAVCVTDGYGREHRLELRLQRLPRRDDSPFVDDELLLSARDVDTMAEGYFADALRRDQLPARLCMMDKAIGGLTSPLRSGRLYFTLSTFRDYPDLWTAGADFSKLRRLSEANPQQKEFRWGDAELVHWIDGNGEQRTGVLVKPDGFDPAKQYPMMVYFYERLSQNLHNYVTPAAGTSPNAAYYVSNGYLWFMPDIQYEIGYPGASCVKCVVSGVQSLIAKGFVDPKAVGAAGHSWGGYQTAFLVTRTHIFKAVESGAPVSNMLSAYGGIRYGTGMSRQFQYEQTQSRIGGTPWEYPLRYWENSPIHFADKVQTPVLILHNDNDGAVPWTQGIEYFVALKRLGKEAYLFNYNGEDHGLRNKANMKDWTRRMSEYFDHHLKGAPAPKWMSEGVPYADRELEKLPYAPSYIDAHLKPAPEPAPREAAEAIASPVEAKAEAASKGAGANGGAVEATAKSGEGDATVAERPAGRRRGGRAARGGEGSARLVVGAAAPDFALSDEAGRMRRLADFRGKQLLIWFYPRAGTPGCTAQGCGLRDAFAELDGQGVAVLGVSFDAPEQNAAFQQEHGFPFPLCSDTKRELAIACGAAADAEAATARRIALLVDADGKVQKVWRRVDPANFATEVLKALPR